MTIYVRVFCTKALNSDIIAHVIAGGHLCDEPVRLVLCWILTLHCVLV